jgi:hypothetical protein
VLLLAAALPGAAAAEPRLQLKLAAFPGEAYANFSVVSLPPSYGALEIWLEGAVGEVQLSTVRVRLNETPLTAFVAVNPMPRGCRAIVRQGLTLSPEYNLRPQGENVLSFSAQDDGKLTYQGQFYLSLDVTATRPSAVGLRPTSSGSGVTAPVQHRPPDIRFTSEWPGNTAQSYLTLDAVVMDAEGLARIVIEVNGKDVEEVVLENEWPVRKAKGFMARSNPPGQVTGEGRRVVLSVPLKLGKGLTVVALRAENTMGLRARLDRTVERRDR